MRYIKQRDHFSCGPTAILNAAKWAGKRVTEKNDRRRVIRASHSTSHRDVHGHRGTRAANLERALRKELDGFATVQRASHLSLNQLIDALASEDVSAIVLYAWKLDAKGRAYRAHYVFCPGGYDGFAVVNGGHSHQTIENFNVKAFETRNMRRCSGWSTNYPRIWLIRR